VRWHNVARSKHQGPNNNTRLAVLVCVDQSAPRIKVLVPPISSQLDVIHLMRYKYNYVMLLLSTTNKGHYSYFGMEQASLCLDKANVVEVNSECIVEI
jgi:hypothetical protein